MAAGTKNKGRPSLRESSAGEISFVLKAAASPDRQDRREGEILKRPCQDHKTQRATSVLCSV